MRSDIIFPFSKPDERESDTKVEPSLLLASTFLRATSHLVVRLTVMCATVDEDSSHLCKILPLSRSRYSQSISADRRDAIASFDARL